MDRPIVASYELISKLGEGAFGEVYEAEHRILGRKTALKRLKRIGTDDEQDERIRMFVREARVLAKLNDDHIVQIYDLFPDDGGLWIAMEYIEGVDAHKLFKSEDFAVSDMAQLFCEMVEGVEVLHSQSIVHRDLKPANFLVDLNTFQVKTTDFGLAFAWSDAALMTRFENPSGTLVFMAPEQLEPGPIDHRADLWSLGVILYYMVSKRFPFFGETQLQTMKQIGTAHFEPLDPESHPGWAVEVTKGLLKLDPQERWQSCREVLKHIPIVHGTQYKATRDLNREELLNAVLKVLPSKGVPVKRDQAIKSASQTLGIERVGKSIRFEFLSALRRGVKRKLIVSLDDDQIARL